MDEKQVAERLQTQERTVTRQLHESNLRALRPLHQLQ